MGMVLGMLAIAATWGVALAALAGLGLGLLRCLRLDRGGSENLFSAIWIGWAIALGGLQVWHLFFPVDMWARAMLLSLGAVGATWNSRAILAGFGGAIRRVLPFGLASVLLALWLANRAMAPEMHPDAGLYHLGTVRWLLEHPIVPGLGNLNWRLAFNSSYFLFMAAMDVAPWAHRAQHVAVYFLVLALSLQVGWSGYSVLLGSRSVRYQDLFRVVLIPAIVRKMWAGIHEVEPDLAIWILGIVIVDQLIGLMEGGSNGKASPTSILTVFLLSSAAVAARLSAGMLGLSASAIGLVLGVRTWKRSAHAHKRAAPVFETSAIAALLLGVWVLRGFLLSGYPAFPSSVGGADVDWRVPKSVADSEARWIMSWARLPGEVPDVVLRDWAWLRPWLMRIGEIGAFDLVAPLVIAAVAFLTALAQRRRWEIVELRLTAVAAAPLLSLGYWFLTAPDPRFAGSAAWLLAGIAVVVAAERWGLRRSLSPARLLLGLMIVVAMAPHLTAPKRIPPGPEKGFYALPHVSVVEVTLSSGLTFLRPTAAMDNQCWEAPLPCAPYPPDDLQLRVPGDLSRGFKVMSTDGD